MKIARVEAVPVRLPFKQVGPPAIALGRPMTTIDFLVVRVETDTGLVGWGETPLGSWRLVKAILDDFIGPSVVGREIDDVPGLMLDLQRVVYVLGRYGLTMFALSGLDTALWDIAGKAAGVPLYQLFGGSRQPVPAYISLWVAYRRSNRAWDWESTDPAVLADRTRAAVATGCRHVKLHGTIESDLRLIREVAGDGVAIMIDTMCRWSYDEAREALLRLKPYDLYWVEEPIFPPEDFAGLARLRQETGARIAAGENACTEYEFAAMLAAGAVDVAQPNVTRIGGVTEFRKALALAAQHGVEVSPHARFLGPGLLATLHLMSAQPQPGLVERVGLDLEASLYPAAVLDPKDGAFILPDGPGLGVEPDLDVLEACRIRDV
ncbi:MAG TPA: mandelate racemase/muconate lactonizing enzyme family protein [Kofleriaceae bacterium]|jgi:L-alanine-DL-glutamate epimerase-like enolase superfamily enzyme